MKRTLGSTLAAIVLTITTLTIPAQAYTMEADGFTITPNQETLDFWTQHKYPLNDRGIYEHSADNWNFCPEFHDGLLLIQDTVSPTEEYAHHPAGPVSGPEAVRLYQPVLISGGNHHVEKTALYPDCPGHAGHPGPGHQGRGGEPGRVALHPHRGQPQQLGRVGDQAGRRRRPLIPQFTGDPSYQDEITREQFAQLAVRLVEVIQKEELPAAAESTFSDSDSLAVRKASQAGIVTGTGGDKFAPTLTTNREQIATMLYRAVGVVKTATGVDLAPKAGSIEDYNDRASVSLWAADGVGALAANGIMKGNGSALSPQEPCSVEQAILLAWRLYAQYGDQAG